MFCMSSLVEVNLQTFFISQELYLIIEESYIIFNGIEKKEWNVPLVLLKNYVEKDIFNTSFVCYEYPNIHYIFKFL